MHFSLNLPSLKAFFILFSIVNGAYIDIGVRIRTPMLLVFVKSILIFGFCRIVDDSCWYNLKIVLVELVVFSG